VSIPPEALALENAHIGEKGQPTLAKAYAILVERWRSGDRDRELALHLLFICWYGQVEPDHVTGFVTDEKTTVELQRVFNDVFQYVEPQVEKDPEMLYVVGLMAKLVSWVLGDSHEWESRSERYRQLYRDQRPGGIDPAVFAGRGAYGEYFGSQAQVENGY
jgi:hypothetical protein